MINVRNLSIFCVAMSIGFSGCGGGGASDQPDTGALSGTIKVDGSPQEGLEVSFQPESGRPSVGTTDAAGHYEMQYTATVVGAKVGKGVIRVSSGSSGEDSSYGSEGEAAEDSGDDSSYGDENEAIPAKYNSEAAANPEMSVTVEPGGTTFDLEISTAE